MGRVTPEVGDPAVREIAHGAYRIIYELRREPAAIYILRFWHGARGTPEFPIA
jgi:plasmid stabilization system protein ParE